MLCTVPNDGRVVRQVHQFQGAPVLEVDVSLRVLDCDARLGQCVGELGEHAQAVADGVEERISAASSFLWRERRQIVSGEVRRVNVCEALSHVAYCTISVLQNASTNARILHKSGGDLQEFL